MVKRSDPPCAKLSHVETTEGRSNVHQGCRKTRQIAWPVSITVCRLSREFGRQTSPADLCSWIAVRCATKERRSNGVGPEGSSSDASTVTLEATVSKHRRKDVLPLNPELVNLLRIWLLGMKPDEPLFPSLARRRTSVMVKKDLERVGIPYMTEKGYADFHAAGRHTHITDLFRTGASLTEARELARHSEIQTTMRYTHVGMEDRARAVSALSAPCQHIVSSSEVAKEHSPTLADAVKHATGEPVVDASADAVAPCDTELRKKAPDDSDALRWRRRGSNPRPAMLP